MTMTKYPLQHLLTIKKKRLDEAERILQEKKEHLALEKRQLGVLEKARDETKRHYNDKLQQLREMLDAGETPGKIEMAKNYLKLVVSELSQKEMAVTQQKKRVDSAKAEVDKAREDYLKKQKDLEKLETHHKEWDKEQQAELQKKEAKEADEIGAYAHERKKRRH